MIGGLAAIVIIILLVLRDTFSDFSFGGSSFPICKNCGRNIYSSSKVCSECEWELIQSSEKYKLLKIRRSEIGKDINKFKRKNNLRVLGIVPHFGQILGIESELKKVRQFKDLGGDFEKYVAQILKLSRYKGVNVTPAGADDGVDIYCVDIQNNKVLVQCKNFKSGKIGNNEVLKLAGSIMNEGSNKGLFISTVGFTRQAQNLKIVKDKTIKLLDWELFYDSFLASLKSKSSSTKELSYTIKCESIDCLIDVIHQFSLDKSICVCGRDQIMHLNRFNHTEWSLSNYTLNMLVETEDKSYDYWME